MKNARERRWVKDTSMVAMTVLVALSLAVYLALDTTHASLDERQAKVSVVRALQQSCEMGVMPSESELDSVASLFPGARLRCVRVDEAIYLTVEGESLAPVFSPVVMQDR